MVGQDIGLQGFGLCRQELQAEPELADGLDPPFPGEIRADRTVDLDTGREAARHDLAGQALGLGGGGDGGPGDEHGTLKGGKRKAESENGGGCFSGLTREPENETIRPFPLQPSHSMRDDYIKLALAKVTDPNVLINIVSRRVKQLKRGNRPLVESLEKLSPEDVALREIIDEKISFEMGEN